MTSFITFLLPKNSAQALYAVLNSDEDVQCRVKKDDDFLPSEESKFYALCNSFRYKSSFSDSKIKKIVDEAFKHLLHLELDDQNVNSVEQCLMQFAKQNPRICVYLNPKLSSVYNNSKGSEMERLWYKIYNSTSNILHYSCVD